MVTFLAIAGSALALLDLILHATKSSSQIVVDVEEVVEKVLAYLGQSTATGAPAIVPAPTGVLTVTSATAPLAK